MTTVKYNVGDKVLFVKALDEYGDELDANDLAIEYSEELSTIRKKNIGIVTSIHKGIQYPFCVKFPSGHSYNFMADELELETPISWKEVIEND